MTTNKPTCTRCNGRGFIWWAGFAPVPKDAIEYKWLGAHSDWIQAKLPCKQCQKEATNETD